MASAVLIIEDEAILAKNLQTYLTRNGYEVRAVDRAEEGLGLIESFKPDVVLLDFKLPGMNGLNALAQIRAISTDVAVVMMTGDGSIEVAVDAIKAGASEYLVKPIALSELKIVLEEQKIRTIGGLREQQIDVRLISATRQPLERMVEEGKFRADLYYRLRMIDIRVPALRERGADVLLLAKHFLDSNAKRYRKEELRLSPEAEKALLAYAWPGNVRELRNLIEQVSMMATERVIQAEDIPFSSLRAAQPDQDADPDQDLNLERLEKRTIERALQRCQGNVTQAARALGISRDTLRYRIERLQLRDDS
jgi:DNA-binding NtrC family response regulator